MVVLRAESQGDEWAITDLLVAAFADHPHSQQTEHIIVQALRQAGAMTLAYVALSDEQKIIGHIAFSPAQVGDEGKGWYALGPVAVLPEMQGKGGGKAMIEHGLQALRSMGAVGCVLVGDPAYYERFNFVNYPSLKVEGVPHEYVLALSFEGHEPCGKIVFHKAFFVTSADAIK